MEFGAESCSGARKGRGHFFSKDSVAGGYSDHQGVREGLVGAERFSLMNGIHERDM